MKVSQTPFIFIGNNLAVDFTNTEIIQNGIVVDLLSNKSDLIRWIQESGIDIDLKQVSAVEFSAALQLREALKRIFAAMMDSIPPPRGSLSFINQHLRYYSSELALRFQNDEYRLQSVEKKPSMSILLGHLAHEGAELLTSKQANQLKRCSNSDCILTFVDTSRSHKRRWCSMETCGNRSKVATHYRKNLS